MLRLTWIHLIQWLRGAQWRRGRATSLIYLSVGVDAPHFNDSWFFSSFCFLVSGDTNWFQVRVRLNETEIWLFLLLKLNKKQCSIQFSSLNSIPFKAANAAWITFRIRSENSKILQQSFEHEHECVFSELGLLEQVAWSVNLWACSCRYEAPSHSDDRPMYGGMFAELERTRNAGTKENSKLTEREKSNVAGPTKINDRKQVKLGIGQCIFFLSFSFIQFHYYYLH